jgi:uncharacterized protein DUF1707
VLISDADREALFEQLSAHAAAGRLTVDELERRVGIVAEARDRSQAAPALVDLPPLAGAPAGSSSARPRGRPRGHGEADAAAPGWQPTDERFRDPRSQRIMRVWVDAAGGRHYVPESA